MDESYERFLKSISIFAQYPDAKPSFDRLRGKERYTIYMKHDGYMSCSDGWGLISLMDGTQVMIFDVLAKTLIDGSYVTRVASDGDIIKFMGKNHLIGYYKVNREHLDDYAYDLYVDDVHNGRITL